MKLLTAILLLWTQQALASVAVTGVGVVATPTAAATTSKEVSRTIAIEIKQPVHTLPTGVFTKFIPSPLITIAPLSRNPLEIRQKCFDDRGFSVDCATWTGYYYTWGGAGHPYAGGPGDGGSGSGAGSGNGNRNGGGSIVIGNANRLRTVLTTALVFLVVTLVTMLL